MVPSTTHSGPFWEPGGRSAGEEGGGGKERGGEGTASGRGEGDVGLPALSDQRAQYFIASNRSQDINYLGRAALKAF